MARWKTLDDLIFHLALVVRFLIFVAVLIHNFRFFFVIGSFLARRAWKRDIVAPDSSLLKGYPHTHTS